MRAATNSGRSSGKPPVPLQPANTGCLTRAQVLTVLREHKAILVQRFGVNELALFGSFARDQATDHSDLDILVSFHGTAD